MFDVFFIMARIFFRGSWWHWKDDFAVMLEWSDKLSNPEGFWFLEIGEKSFMVPTDLCAIIELVFDEFLEVLVEFID